jgi:hypothetical protein
MLFYYHKPTMTKTKERKKRMFFLKPRDKSLKGKDTKHGHLGGRWGG